MKLMHLSLVFLFSFPVSHAVFEAGCIFQKQDSNGAISEILILKQEGARLFLDNDPTIKIEQEQRKELFRFIAQIEEGQIPCTFWINDHQENVASCKEESEIKSRFASASKINVSQAPLLMAEISSFAQTYNKKKNLKFELYDFKNQIITAPDTFLTLMHCYINDFKPYLNAEQFIALCKQNIKSSSQINPTVSDYLANLNNVTSQITNSTVQKELQRWINTATEFFNLYKTQENATIKETIFNAYVKHDFNDNKLKQLTEWYGYIDYFLNLHTTQQALQQSCSSSKSILIVDSLWETILKGIILNCSYTVVHSCVPSSYLTSLQLQSLFQHLIPQQSTKSGQQICYQCDKPARQQCAQCKITSYCSRECQIKDWEKHKQMCIKKTNVKKQARN